MCANVGCMDLRDGYPDADVSTRPGTWRVSPPLTWAKVVATLAFLGVAVVYSSDRMKLLVTLAGAVLLGAYALRDLIAPVRLTADESGLTVIAGYRRRKLLDWSQIERIRVDEHSRLGLRSEMLEIDAGDSLHLLSTYDLNAPVSDVAERLLELRGTFPGFDAV
jgi:hypothetical protein